MATTGELRAGVARDAVVRSLGRAVERPCSRPSCAAPATATLTFRYGTREAWIERLVERVDPQAYDLCVTHAARTQPPQGWDLRDRRPEDERRPAEPHTTPADLGGDRTVAVLAAALRSVPDPVSEDAIVDPAGAGRIVEVLTSPADDGDEPPAPVLEAEQAGDEGSSEQAEPRNVAPAPVPAVGTDAEDPAPSLFSDAEVDEPRRSLPAHGEGADPEPSLVPRPPLVVRDRAEGELAAEW